MMCLCRWPWNGGSANLILCIESGCPLQSHLIDLAQVICWDDPLSRSDLTYSLLYMFTRGLENNWQLFIFPPRGFRNINSLTNKRLRETTSKLTLNLTLTNLLWYSGAQTLHYSYCIRRKIIIYWILLNFCLVTCYNIKLKIGAWL